MKISMTMSWYSETDAVVPIKDYLWESAKNMKTCLGAGIRKVKWE